MLAGLSILNLPLVVLGPLSVLSVFLLWGVGGTVAVKAMFGPPLVFGMGFLEIDPLSGFFLLILSLVAGAVLINIWGRILNQRASGAEDRQLTKELGLTFLFIVTMILSLSAKNLGLIWVGIEGTTLISALLIGLENSKKSIEAAWKYVILCTVGLSFSLFGLFLLVFASAQADTQGVLEPDILIRARETLPLPLLKLSFLLMLIGFATKAGIAPLHSWLPDAYSQAPTPTSALLSGALLNCSVYALIRIAMVMDAGGIGPFMRTLFLGFGLFSVGLAALFFNVQTDLKRLLAYSSIEHVGLITLGLGLGSPLALFATVLHIFGHSVAKVLVFLSSGELVLFFHSQDMNRMVGTLKRLPYSGGGLALGMGALAGMPPFLLFISKLLLIAAAFSLGKTGTGLLMIAFLAVAFVGWAYHGIRILFGEDPWHHHHDTEAHGDHEIKPEPPRDEKPYLHLQAGMLWRRASFLILAFILMLSPLLFINPFSQAIASVTTFIAKGDR